MLSVLFYHPLLVRLHDSISEEGFHYLVFDLWVKKNNKKNPLSHTATYLSTLRNGQKWLVGLEPDRQPVLPLPNQERHVHLWLLKVDQLSVFICPVVTLNPGFDRVHVNLDTGLFSLFCGFAEMDTKWSDRPKMSSLTICWVVLFGFFN